MARDPKKKGYIVGKGKPPRNWCIKKGQVLNPKGNNTSPEKRALKELTIASLSEAIKQVMTGTIQEAQRLLKDPNVTLGHKVILRAAVDAATHGNYEKFNSILERVIGKVPTKVEIESPSGSLTPKQVTFYLPDNLRDIEIKP